jgi:hypothetical protein
MTTEVGGQASTGLDGFDSPGLVVLQRPVRSWRAIGKAAMESGQVTQPIGFVTTRTECKATRVRMKSEVTLQSNAYTTYVTVSLPQQ